MNYTAKERIKILNGNCWSKDEVRRLIMDCEELETKSQSGQVQLEQRVRARLEELGRDFLTYMYDNADVLIYDSELENLQPLLEENGFIVKEKYDPKIHGDAFEAEEGDEVWIFTEEMKRIATAELKKRRQPSP